MLADYGERRILDALVLPRFRIMSDDCAVMPAAPSGHETVMTIDPCPTPVVCLLDGEEIDYWHYGWMTVLINVSDLAAMGAEPAGILISAVMPAEMTVRDYSRFLDGLEDASREWDCPILGGNIKDGSSFSVTGTAVGHVPERRMLRRTGARDGDMVCVFGAMGLFWAAVLTRLHELSITETGELELALARPTAKVRTGAALAASGRVTSCMDASDGVGSCLVELARQNGLDVVLDSGAIRPSRIVEQVGLLVEVDPRNLMLSWGNWELVVTVAQESLGKLQAISAETSVPCTPIGRLQSIGEDTVVRPGRVFLDSQEPHSEVTDFSSERFTATSYFTSGIDSYAEWLVAQPFVRTPER